MSPPEAAETARRVRQIYDKTIDLEQWEKVPFPSPLDSYFDFIYTIDQDAGTFILSKWSDVAGNRTPLAFEASLVDLCETSSISVESLRQSPLPSIPNCGKVQDLEFDSVSLEPLNIQTGLPTAMLELQQQLFSRTLFFYGAPGLMTLSPGVMEAVLSTLSAELSYVSLHVTLRCLTIATYHCLSTIVRFLLGSFLKKTYTGFMDF